MNLNFLEKCEKKIIDITGIESIITCYYNLERLMKICKEDGHFYPESVKQLDLKIEDSGSVKNSEIKKNIDICND